MIKKLPAEISNQIAAGEVIERPAAVVKELVENAIDAGATRIVIAVEEAGKALIAVSDNGCGIAKDDMALLFERHATSKISQLDDIYAIATLGFRGEALASIAAVSRVLVTARTAHCATGHRVQVVGGRSSEMTPAATNVGTSIEVRDLFYNTPVRYKFLGSDRSEAAAITSTVERLMLGNPAIQFSYSLDGKVLRSSDGDNQLKHVLDAVYGAEVVRGTLAVSTVQGAVSVHGFISKPEYSRGSRRYQTLFVNGRYVECSAIQDAVNERYRTLNTIHRFPLYVLHIALPAKLYDVNIHPAKTDIKFHDSALIERIVGDSVAQCLAANKLVPAVALTNADKAADLPAETSKVEQYFERFNKKMAAPEVYPTDPAGGAPLGEQIASYTLPPDKVGQPTMAISNDDDDCADLFIDDDAAFGDQIALENAQLRRATHYDNLTIVGVLFNTYIICQRDDSAFLIDQHAAHERVLYEQFLSDFRNQAVEAQYLLKPFIYQSDHHTSNYIEQLATDIKQMGINIEPFGDFSWLVRSVPAIKGVPFSEQSVKLILDAIDINQCEALTEHNLEAIILASCKAAVKARDVLSNSEIYGLLELLRSYNQPYTCPHGRPIIIELTEYELEKLFKRIQ